MALALEQMYTWLARVYLPGSGDLRDEDRKKARELVGLAEELARALPRSRPATLVDAAAGKAYAGLLAAQFLLPDRSRVVLIEREPRRAGLARQAARAVEREGVDIEVREADVADAGAWPDAPDVVVALHACGEASDRVIARAAEKKARTILVAPCCVAADIPAAQRAARKADRLHVPRHGTVRAKVVESLVVAERTLRLEAAGYETTVVSFAAPTVTPYHLLFRARRVGEPNRTARAGEELARWLDES
jgi:hypothetical protein